MSDLISSMPLILPPPPPPGPRLEYVSSPGHDGSVVTTYSIDRTPITDPRERALCRDLLVNALALLDAQGTSPTTTPAAEGEQLPPFSGGDPLCRKCSHVDAYTDYRAAGEPSSNEPPRLRPSPKGERLERRCGRCGFIWDEALVPPTAVQLEAEVSTWLSEQIARALRTAPTSGHVHQPGEDKDHSCTSSYALCTSDIDTLTAAVLNVISLAVLTLPTNLRGEATS